MIVSGPWNGVIRYSAHPVAFGEMSDDVAATIGGRVISSFQEMNEALEEVQKLKSVADIHDMEEQSVWSEPGEKYEPITISASEFESPESWTKRSYR